MQRPVGDGSAFLLWVTGHPMEVVSAGLLRMTAMEFLGPEHASGHWWRQQRRRRRVMELFRCRMSG